MFSLFRIQKRMFFIGLNYGERDLPAPTDDLGFGDLVATFTTILPPFSESRTLLLTESILLSLSEEPAKTEDARAPLSTAADLPAADADELTETGCGLLSEESAALSTSRSLLEQNRKSKSKISKKFHIFFSTVRNPQYFRLF